SAKTSPLRIFGQPKMATLVVLGFSSGLPFYLTSKTLQAWMTTAKVDLATIGFFSLVTLPYSLKFVWAPLMDRYTPPFLGRRRGVRAWLSNRDDHNWSAGFFPRRSDRLADSLRYTVAAHYHRHRRDLPRSRAGAQRRAAEDPG